ncbi:AraC family transcriptional regulator [Actinomadura sp. DC4]|uniref:helix-turn-helix transcriptional regulator n=1 Tax=Actinomadura sp. DC4 TaxID=3055069 RepID=UPI0025B275BA|nr:AraC family transcriptional regulator [Actinomadura sp. DC4]MDN3355269.1 AraC family transcriptional regulator [Actinomadura sp. DC4]
MTTDAAEAQSMDGIASIAAPGTIAEYRTDSVEDYLRFWKGKVIFRSVTLLGNRERSFRYRLRLYSSGPAELGEILYGEDAQLDFVEVVPKFRISIPLNGVIAYKHRDVENTADKANAAIFGPGDPSAVRRWPGGTRILTMRLDSEVVDAALRGMTGAPAGRPIVFAPALPIDVEPAASWMSLAANIGQASALLKNPLVAAPFADSLARGLLLASRHRYTRELERAVSVPNSATVRAAVDFIEEHADTPVTVSQIALHCRVSARTLHNAFKRHMGMSPMAYARRVRLGKVHADLRTSDPSTVTVASLANKWGFTHLGRLAAEYRSLYGTLPSETLRRSQ